MPFQKGHKPSTETRRKMSQSRIGKYSGAQHPKWNGGRSITPNGYVLILSPNHPNASVGRRYVFEHRLVMEKFIGRKLKPFPIETVHHKNGDKLDNRIENLELVSASDHAKIHNHLEEINEFRKQNKKCQVDGNCTHCRKIIKIRNSTYMLCRNCCRKVLGHK